MDILQHIAIGLGLESHFFTRLHDQHNDTLRLISYHPTVESVDKSGSSMPQQQSAPEMGNRCKEHSDYGTITLLSTDGVSGLELFHEGKWMPVPYIPGTLVVNIGSLLSNWTGGVLKATLHRVAGPASLNSTSKKEDLLKAVTRRRTSIAFFADPNEEVSVQLNRNLKGEGLESAGDWGSSLGSMSVAEYTKWRSGGIGMNDRSRSGVSFTNEELDRRGI